MKKGRVISVPKISSDKKFEYVKRRYTFTLQETLTLAGDFSKNHWGQQHYYG